MVTGLEPVVPQRKGTPGAPLFIHGSGGAQHASPGVIVDTQGQVWRLTEGDAQDSDEYWLVASVDAALLARLEALCEEASKDDSFEYGFVCEDCPFGTRLDTFRRAADGGRETVDLAVDGQVRKRRTNTAADALIRWFIAVYRYAPRH